MKDAAETSLPSLCNVACYQNIGPVFVFEIGLKKHAEEEVYLNFLTDGLPGKDSWNKANLGCFGY